MTRRKLVLLTLGVVALLAITAATLDTSKYSILDKEYYLTEEEIAFIRPGLSLDVESVQINASRKVEVVFTLTDDRGAPLDIDGIITPGPISVRFILGTIKNGETQYTAYTTRNRTGPGGETIVQPTSDSGRDFELLEPGRYRFVTNTALPQGYDATATHSVGIYATRDLRDPCGEGICPDLGRYRDNDVYSWIPAGGEVTNFREVVLKENCNRCHDPLAFHGGSRRDPALCVMCHTKGVTDDELVPVDFKIMIHKIHRGASLPSVEDGTDYIVGGRNYSDVHFPQEIRNCTTCHEGAAQGDNWFLNPQREQCGSCHDNVNFMSGDGHAGGAQISDNLCANCHIPEGELEFDASIMGGHTIELKSAQLEGINAEILSVTGTNPGDHPTIMFTLKTDDGENIPPASMSRLAATFSGPTTDYRVENWYTEDIRAKATASGNAFTVTLDNTVPNAMGKTFAIALEGRKDAVLNAMTTKMRTVREPFVNPIHYFAVGGGDVVERRMVVADENCDTCHDNLIFHGNNRQNPQYCVMCHFPGNTDAARRPAEELPAETIDFKFMIHRIHTGEELTNEYTVYGFGNTPHDFTEIIFPGDTRNCVKCHEGTTFRPPSAGVGYTVAERQFFSPLPPNTAACLGCHDTVGAAAHAYVNIAPFGEACATCHGEDRDVDVAKAHARPGEGPPLP